MNNGTLYVNGTPDNTATLSYRRGMRSAQVQHEIFVSHQRQDVETARQLAVLLSRNGHPCYVDDLDPQVDGDSPELEGYLRQMIGNSQALLAVVSRNTVASWWVPMEIGVALDREKHIGTYLVNRTELPSYLWRWPVMQSYGEAATWANHAKRSQPEAYHRAWRGLSSLQRSVNNITVR